jgi:glycerol-3-phosphate acyltransferase PlsY
MGMQPLVYVAALISVILIWRHKGNIQRLLAGEEK